MIPTGLFLCATRWRKFLQLHWNTHSSSNRETLTVILSRNCCVEMSGRAKPAAQSRSESDDTLASWLKKPREVCNRNEAEWITEDDWDGYIKRNLFVDHKSVPVVSIFRVPNVLKEDSKKIKAYVPKRVSLGPYHHTSAELRPMDNHKGKGMCRMMRRFNLNRENDLNNIDFSVQARNEIMQLEDEIRNNYDETIRCDRETLSRMLRLDGCFILEILRALRALRCDQVPGASNYYEPIFDSDKIVYTGQDILEDILKLENQIPLVVLRKLLELELISGSDAVDKFLIEMLSELGELLNPFQYDMTQRSWLRADEHHLLSWFHSLIVSLPPPLSQHNKFQQDLSIDCGSARQSEDQAVNGVRNIPEEFKRKGGINFKCGSKWCIIQKKHKGIDGVGGIPRAVELRNAGIKFKQCDGGIKQIYFDRNNTTIYLPHITITDSTEILFRNLIAFEMSKPRGITYAVCYVHLMDSLISLEEDVALLTRTGIVTNLLGSDIEVAELFNGLGKGVTIPTQAFENLTKEVNAHYRNDFKVRFAELVKDHVRFSELVKDHFSSPWKALALMGAIVILLLTALQTIFSILSVYK